MASLKLMEYLKYVCNSEVTPMGKSITEVLVNTLENVTMMMEKYKSYEGDIEIVNQSGGELTTGEWYSIQRCEDGEYRIVKEVYFHSEERIDTYYLAAEFEIN